MIDGMWVEDEQNGLRKVSVWLHVDSYRHFGPKGSLPLKQQEQLLNWKKKFKI